MSLLTHIMRLNDVFHNILIILYLFHIKKSIHVCVWLVFFPLRKELMIYEACGESIDLSHTSHAASEIVCA